MAKKTDNSLDSILQQYGVNAQEFETISTGSLVLDAVLGGGVTLGSMIALWGIQGSGKSSIAFNIMKAFCKKGKKCAFIDVEKAFNARQQKAFGLFEYVESNQITVLTADNYEDVYKICLALAKSQEYSLIAIDSETMINEVVPEDVDIASDRPGQKARQSAKMLNGLKSVFYSNNVACILLSHARANLDMTGNMYAPKEKMAGGFALRHIPDVIVQVQPGQKLKRGEELYGQVLHVMSEKNKFTVPFQKLDVKIIFGKGIDKKTEIVDLAIEQGLITQSGSFFKLPNGDTVRGTDALYSSLSNEQLRSLRDSLQPLIKDE